MLSVVIYCQHTGGLPDGRQPKQHRWSMIWQSLRDVKRPASAGIVEASGGLASGHKLWTTQIRAAQDRPIAFAASFGEYCQAASLGESPQSGRKAPARLSLQGMTGLGQRARVIPRLPQNHSWAPHMIICGLREGNRRADISANHSHCDPRSGISTADGPDQRRRVW